MVNSRVLRTREAAKVLNVSPRTLEILRARGAGPSFVRLTPGLIGYRPEDLEAYLRQRLERPKVQ